MKPSFGKAQIFCCKQNPSRVSHLAKHAMAPVAVVDKSSKPLGWEKERLEWRVVFSSKDAMNPWICKTLLGEMSNAHSLKRVWVKGIMFVFELDFKWWFCFQRNVSKPLVLYRLFVTLHLSAAIILLLKPLVIRPDINVPINCLWGTRDEAIFVSRGGGGDFESSRDQGLGRGRGMSNFSLYEKMIVYRLKVGNKSIL